LEGFFREFHEKAIEIGAFPNTTICLTVFLLIVGRRHVKRNPR
jgi:hypothetical protein